MKKISIIGFVFGVWVLWSCQTEETPLTPTAQPGFIEFRLDGEPFRLQGSGALFKDTSFMDVKSFSCGASTIDAGNALIVSTFAFQANLNDDCMPLLTYSCADSFRFAAIIQWQGLDTTYFAESCEIVLTDCADRFMSGVFSGVLGDGRALTGAFRDIEYDVR